MNAETLTKALVEENMPLVDFVAARIGPHLPEAIERSDLIQWGSLGLLDAIKKYNPERDVLFRTYAEIRIRGAIIDGLRSMDLVGRAGRTLEKSLSKAIQELQNENGRSPDSKEIAKRMKISVDEVHELRDRTQPIVNIPFDVDGEMLPARPEDLVSRMATLEKVKKLVRGHDPTSRACFLLFFIWGFKLEEIGELFDVSASRISQRIKEVQRRQKE